jgi:hypothetical protein
VCVLTACEVARDYQKFEKHCPRWWIRYKILKLTIFYFVINCIISFDTHNAKIGVTNYCVFLFSLLVLQVFRL